MKRMRAWRSIYLRMSLHHQALNHQRDHSFQKGWLTRLLSACSTFFVSDPSGVT